MEPSEKPDIATCWADMFSAFCSALGYEENYDIQPSLLSYNNTTDGPKDSLLSAIVCRTRSSVDNFCTHDIGQMFGAVLKFVLPIHVKCRDK